MKKIIIALLAAATIATANNSSLFEQAENYQKEECFTEAIICYKKIIASNPFDINAFFKLGCCYLSLAEAEKAISAFETVLRLNPDVLPACYNIAYTNKTMGKLPQAIEQYKEIIHLHPDYEPAQLALGFAYITHGDFIEGWKQHERYLKKSGKNGDALRSLLSTNNVSGKRIVLKPEGHLGDTLLFIRYAERLHNMGAYVIAAVQTSLLPLLTRCSYIDELVPYNATIPVHDAHASFMSLPAIFNDTEYTAPHTVPYIFPDPALVNFWQEQLAADTNYKIGICWHVDKKNDESRLPIARRSCPLHYFLPLSTIKGVSFYSLQKYDGIEQLDNLSSDFSLHFFDDLDEQSGTFMDTAAIMKNLNLVITVDTAIAHLAGALGVPVWLLHPVSTDWRWINNRTDSYWYPTMTIFKQQKPFDWHTVISRVESALRTVVE